MINEEQWTRGRFEWQEGYGAFSYSRSHLGAIIRYIEDQEKHHSITTFAEEYVAILESFGIEYDPKYILGWRDDGTAR